jgi:hypothetical protein
MAWIRNTGNNPVQLLYSHEIGYLIREPHFLFGFVPEPIQSNISQLRLENHVLVWSAAPDGPARRAIWDAADGNAADGDDAAASAAAAAPPPGAGHAAPARHAARTLRQAP